MLIVCRPNVKLAGISVKIVWEVVGNVLNKVFKTCDKGCSKMLVKAADSSAKSWNKGSNVALSSMTLMFQCPTMLLMIFLSVCKILRVVALMYL